MSITVEEAPTVGPDAGDAPRSPDDRVEAPRRGSTTVATRVVERVVGWVAATTPGVAAAHLTGIRGWLHDQDDNPAEAQVEAGDEGLRIGVSVAVEYPEPIAEIAARVRQQVSAALRDQLSMTAERVDVTVIELRRPSRDRVALRRRVQ